MRATWVMGLMLVAMAGAAQALGPKDRIALQARHRVSTETGCATLRLPQQVEHLPYGPGESLSYEATLNGVTAGTAAMRFNEKSTEAGHLVYSAEVKAQANPVVQLWGKMQAQLVTVLDPDLGLPLRMESATHQDKNLYTEAVEFSPGKKLVAAHTAVNGSPMKQSLSVETDALDVLSLVYYARSRMFEVGQPFCIDLYQSRLIWRIRGTVRGRETVETDAGPFDAYVATGVAVAQLGNQKGAPAIIKEPRPFTTWMTADEDRIPVLLKAPTPLGEVVVKLTRFEQGRRLARAH